MTSLQQQKAKTFLSLHSGKELLLLPNIWNPLGARILEAKGYKAAATASAAISATLGYTDGERIKRATLIDIIFRIANSVAIPVTADIETGFADSISILKETIIQVIDSGIVGINIEDSLAEGGALRNIDKQCERIATIREIADVKGLHLVINARVDSFLTAALKSQDEKIEDAIIRAKAYTKAGADCIYPIGPGDKETLLHLRKNIELPMNVLVSANAEPLTVLKNIGINRISFGPFVFRSCIQKFIGIADELQAMGNYDCFSSKTLSGAEIQKFLRDERE